MRNSGLVMDAGSVAPGKIFIAAGKFWRARADGSAEWVRAPRADGLASPTFGGSLGQRKKRK